MTTTTTCHCQCHCLISVIIDNLRTRDALQRFLCQLNDRLAVSDDIDIDDDDTNAIPGNSTECRVLPIVCMGKGYLTSVCAGCHYSLSTESTVFNVQPREKIPKPKPNFSKTKKITNDNLCVNDIQECHHQEMYQSPHDQVSLLCHTK